jgi:4-amino-4-deoxy-L-arabinose transferase-like glycosyltransferase
MQVVRTLGQLTKKQYWWGIAVVLILATALRFFQLGQVPHGMTWDEAAIGYNGFAIFTTRRDEWLTRLPVSFWSFGDYKAPLAIYLNGFFTAAFGMNLWAVRLPFALSGVAAVLALIYLTRIVLEQAGEKPEQARFLAIVAGGLMAFSPWHLHFSRIGFESGMAIMFYLWGLYFFHKALIVKVNWRRYVDFTLSILSLVASVYTYHSAKFTAPLAILFLVVWHRRKILQFWREFLTASVIGLIALRPLIMDALFGKGLERAGTLIFSQGLSNLETIKLAMSQFTAHLTPKFLILGDTTTLRHGDGQWGVLLPTTLILVLVGLIFSWSKRGARSVNWLALSLMVLGLLPAALATEVPHANRALLALPGFLLIAVLGLRTIFQSQLSYSFKRIVIGTLILLHTVFFIAYLNHYYTQFAAKSAADFQDGYLEAFQFTLPYERGEDGKKAVDKIIFTSRYGQPYIYALFVRKTNPIWYQGGSLVKYEFKDEITIGDLERPNTLVIASQFDDLLGKNDQADQVIYGSDGAVRFRIYLNQ